MRFFVTLLMTLIFASQSHASAVLPETCAEFVQMINGGNDKPSGKYSLVIQKGANICTKKGQVQTFHLRADGVPVGTKFQVASRNGMGRTIRVLEGIHLSDGNILSLGKWVDTVASFVVDGFERGEPSQFLFLDPQMGTTDTVFFLPYPVEPAVMDDLKVSMYYVRTDPAHLFEMVNLMPEEKVALHVDGELGPMEEMITASKSGRAVYCVSWGDAKPPQGNGLFEVRRANGTLAINFPWVRDESPPLGPLIIFTINHSPTPEEIKLAITSYEK